MSDFNRFQRSEHLDRAYNVATGLNSNEFNIPEVRLVYVCVWNVKM